MIGNQNHDPFKKRTIVTFVTFHGQKQITKDQFYHIATSDGLAPTKKKKLYRLKSFLARRINTIKTQNELRIRLRKENPEERVKNVSENEQFQKHDDFKFRQEDVYTIASEANPVHLFLYSR